MKHWPSMMPVLLVELTVIFASAQTAIHSDMNGTIISLLVIASCVLCFTLLVWIISRKGIWEAISGYFLAKTGIAIAFTTAMSHKGFEFLPFVIFAFGVLATLLTLFVSALIKIANIRKLNTKVQK
jgi:hypothetical protein